MKWWGNFAKDYLTFSRKDRIAVLVISGLILLALFLPKIASVLTANPNYGQPDTTWFSTAKRLQTTSDSTTERYERKLDDDNGYAFEYDRRVNADNRSIKGELFYFDPNTMTEEDWKRLGLRDKTVQTIKNYLRKGGHFYKPEDLQKVYGLHKDEYERLLPYIKIESNQTKFKEEKFVEKSAEIPAPTKNNPPRYSVIDINSADTSAFISLPGIGSKLALRIVNFRDKLGGFYSVEQIGETYGLPDSTFQKIKQYLKLDNAPVKKININTATVDELKAHPYIKFSIANPIVAYRNEHGVFSKIEDIKKVMAVTDEVYKKISPYLTLQ